MLRNGELATHRERANSDVKCDIVVVAYRMNDSDHIPCRVIRGKQGTLHGHICEIKQRQKENFNEE